MSEFFEQIDELRRHEGRAALATLVSTRGTTPRKEGAQMWVGEGGRILGSVTIGGCVDAQVMAEAEDVLADSRPRLLELSLGDEDAWEIGLTCGGTIEVFLEPVALGAPAEGAGALPLYETLREHVGRGRAGALVTRMDPPAAGAKLLVLSDGWDTGDPAILSEALVQIRRRAAKVIWLNPLLGSPDYQPLTQGMVAALPHLDAFLPAHNLESLRALARHLTL